MAYMTLMCRCYTCGAPLLCNPLRVPSVPAHLTTTGEKEPVCKACVDRANPQRAKRGLPPIVILPGAYDPEPTDAESASLFDD